MRSRFLRLLPLVGIFALPCHPAHTQQSSRVVQLELGDALVTGFSGILPPTPGTRPPAGKSAADLTFINPDGPSARVITLSRPGSVWNGRLIAAPKPFSVFAKDVGQVFGIAFDDQTPPNIYLAATSQFGLNTVRRARDGTFERVKKGAPGAGWMRGQFGLDLQGGPGAIYKIDGRTGAPTLFANVTLDGVPNPGPALGNLAFDAARKQLFVSDLYTGMIHRFDLDGRELDRFDHGVNGRPAQRLAPVAFNPANRPNFGSDRFDTEKPETWGYAVAARQVWGVAVHQDRLYYSVASGPQIWSIGLQRDGSFANDPRWELDVPAQAGPLPISDIAFSHQGAMLLAQRALVAGAYDFTAFTRPGEPQVFRVWLKGPNDPPSPGRWKVVPEEYAVGFAGTHRNTNGGVALGYGYGQDGALSTNACEFSLWTTGQNLRNNAALRERLQPGGELVVHGLAGMPASPVRTFNEPPWTSYFIDYDDAFNDPRASGHLGSVRIYSKPCVPPAVYSGPGYRTNPPYTYPPTVVVETECRRPDCPPPPRVGELIVQKKVVFVGAVLLPPATYAVTVTCGSNVTTLSLAENVPQTISNIPYGTSCSVVEPPPPVPPSVCPQNTGVWTTVIAPPSPVTINTTTATVTVTNTLECKPHDGGGNGYMRVSKVIENRTEASLSSLTALTFPMTATCGGNTTTLNVQLTTPGIVSNVPVGTVCSVTETLPPPPPIGCGSGRTPTWGTPAYAPATVTITSGAGPVITVKNVLTCEPSDGGQVGELIVKKTVAFVGALSLPPATYPVTVTCGSNVTTLSLAENVPQSVGNIPYGTSCSVTEPPPPVPPSMCPLNTGVWTTVITPPSPITINAVTTNVTVANTLECKQGDGGGNGYMRVSKLITNRAQATMAQLNGLTFPMTVTCGGNTTSLNVQLTTPGIVSNIPVGTVCTVAETLPPPPAGNCTNGSISTWGTPSYAPASVTITSGAGPLITVTNVLTCRPPDGGGGQGTSLTGDLVVTKQITNNTPAVIVNNLSYPISVSCSSGMSPAVVTSISLSGGGSQTISGMALGATCAVTETQPALPTVGCPDRKVPAWQPPVYSPAMATISSTSSTIVVQNTVSCVDGTPKKVTELKCPRPQFANSEGSACVCPSGQQKRGAKCVTPLECRSPAKPNKAGSACVCPDGMTLRGNACVERERRGPSVEERIIRGVPGVLGPGGFGGGGDRGGGGGDRGGGGRGGPAGGGSPGGGGKI